ncbi:MAG: hypothetical protein M1817_001340 [Caeruleum heppii]|nr:MAG: hypothetical protein M1817_001340 [Caeruleum heppii]
MLSRLFHVARSLFTSRRQELTPSVQDQITTPDTREESEIRPLPTQIIEVQEMVQTRRQSRGIQPGGTDSPGAASSPHGTTRKRTDVSHNTTPSSTRKRRRVEVTEEENQTLEGTDGVDRDLLEQLRTATKAASDDEDEERGQTIVVQEPREEPPATEVVHDVERIPTQQVAVVIDPPAPKNVVTEKDDGLDDEANNVGIEHGNGEEATEPSQANEVEKTTAPTHQSSHIRFGSADVDDLITSTVQGEEDAKEVLEDMNVDAESEDEAPEAETMTAGRQKAEAVLSEAARAVQEQNTKVKEKRKRREERLQRQAAATVVRQQRKLAKVAKRKGLNEAADDGAAKGVVSTYKDLDRTALPDLLPEELLAMEPYERPPTPPDDPEELPHRPKKIKHFAEPKPIKDIRRDGVDIRVVEQPMKHLAPRSVQSSKSIKEGWLAGRTGRGGRMAFERRKMGGGFLRR